MPCFVMGLNVVYKRTKASEVLVYLQIGSYDGVPLHTDGWHLVYQGSPQGQAGSEARLDDFVDGVRVAAGDVASFYVYSRRGQLCSEGDEEGRAYGEDNAVIVHEGLVTKGDPCRKVGWSVEVCVCAV